MLIDQRSVVSPAAGLDADENDTVYEGCLDLRLLWVSWFVPRVDKCQEQGDPDRSQFSHTNDNLGEHQGYGSLHICDFLRVRVRMCLCVYLLAEAFNRRNGQADNPELNGWLVAAPGLIWGLALSYRAVPWMLSGSSF
ncbi:hypothetical protein BGZ63DRAFT_426656 [Mariannaea sp. PMI_226]|nr:hypothetical protein BGZ63DRAFT_426656 [Mariannaea sp. PMI_226]